MVEFSKICLVPEYCIISLCTVQLCTVLQIGVNVDNNKKVMMIVFYLSSQALCIFQTTMRRISTVRLPFYRGNKCSAAFFSLQKHLMHFPKPQHKYSTYTYCCLVSTINKSIDDFSIYLQMLDAASKTLKNYAFISGLKQ